jgi:hypothetical protein
MRRVSRERWGSREEIVDWMWRGWRRRQGTMATKGMREVKELAEGREGFVAETLLGGGGAVVKWKMEIRKGRRHPHECGC